MADSDGGLLPAIARIAALAADPDAPRSARDCTWIPGTGYCPHQTCREDCVFRAQREAEARSVVRLRQARRLTQLPLAGRPIRPISATTGGRVGTIDG